MLQLQSVERIQSAMVRNRLNRYSPSALSFLFSGRFLIVLLLLLGTARGFCAPGEAGLKWGPVLGLITPANASIKWATTAPGTCSVVCNGQEIGKVKSSSVFHEFFLEHLSPATSFEYFISLKTPQGTTKFGPFSFKTPPLDEANWSFLVYGDTRGNNQDPYASTNKADHEKVIRAMVRQAPSHAFCIHTGDLVDRGERNDNWDVFFQIVNPLLKEIPFLPVRGNHDISSDIFSNIFYAPLSEGDQKINWYSFRYRNAQFVFLDTGWDGRNDVSVNMDKLKAQLPFLEKVLEQATKDGIPWKFVTFHIPAITSGRYGCNDALMSALVPICEKYQVTCCFSAHCHIYERSVRNGVIYVVSGGGGAPFQEPPGSKPNPSSVFGAQTHHFLSVGVSKENVEFTVYSPDGEIIDSFTQKTAALPANPCWNPSLPTIRDIVTVTSKRPGKLHWGINGWTLPPASVWPSGSERWFDGKAIETPLTPAPDGKSFQVRIGSFENLPSPVTEIDCVFHYSDNTWGKDFRIPVRE